jgi:rubredoxin
MGNNALPEPGTKVFQCKHCLTIYDEDFGDEINGIMPGTLFSDISGNYECATCNAPKDDFVEIMKMSLIV